MTLLSREVEGPALRSLGNHFRPATDQWGFGSRSNHGANSGRSISGRWEGGHFSM